MSALTAYERFKERVIGKVDAARGQCWFLHRWGRWQLINRSVKVFAIDDQWHETHESWQRRECSRCGFVSFKRNFQR